jgi:polyisoprenoid-binding protein YceI
MKTSIKTKRIALFYLIFVFIVSCQDSSKKEDTPKNDTLNTAASQDMTAKKDTTSVTVKTNVKKWNEDASKAQITFSVKGPFGTVHGSLTGLKSTIVFDENNLAASSIRASVDPKTISTGIKLRNRDLQKEKYLNSDSYSLISFRSEKIQKSGAGYNAIGDLTIKGVTKRVEIPFSFSEKGNSGIFKGNFAIQRQDYGVGKSGGTIGSTVTINLEVPVTK